DPASSFSPPLPAPPPPSLPYTTLFRSRTVSTNVVKIVGNTFLANFISTILGTAFGTPYAFGGISQAIGNKLAGMDFLNGAMQVLGGAAAIYTLGTAGSKTVQDNNVIGGTGATVYAGLS